MWDLVNLCLDSFILVYEAENKTDTKIKCLHVFLQSLRKLVINGSFGYESSEINAGTDP